MGKFSLNIKHYTASQLYGLDRHNLRKTLRHSTNIDSNRTHENKMLVGGVNPLYYEAKREIAERVNGRITKASIYISEFIFTLPKGIPVQEAEHYFSDCVEILGRVNNPKNIVQAVIHYDEPDAQPHMHLDFCPITCDGKLSRKKIFTRESLTELQYGFPQKLQELGWNIELPERTERGQYTKTVNELKKQNDRLCAQIDALYEERDELLEGNIDLAENLLNHDLAL